MGGSVQCSCILSFHSIIAIPSTLIFHNHIQCAVTRKCNLQLKWFKELESEIGQVYGIQIQINTQLTSSMAHTIFRSIFGILYQCFNSDACLTYLKRKEKRKKKINVNLNFKRSYLLCLFSFALKDANIYFFNRLYGKWNQANRFAMIPTKTLIHSLFSLGTAIVKKIHKMVALWESAKKKPQTGKNRFKLCAARQVVVCSLS